MMKTGFVRRLAAAALALSMAACAAALPALAAEEYYAVTFRPGDKGTITDTGGVSSAVEQRTTAAGAAAYKIAAGSSVSGMPAVTPEQGYFLIGFVPSGTGNAVTAADCYSGIEALDRSYDYVAAYGLSAASDAFAFVVRYLDASTGEQVAPSEQGVASDGATITRSPRSIPGYHAAQGSTGSQTMTITNGGVPANTMEFYYELETTTVTTTSTETVVVDGGTTVVTETVTATGSAETVAGTDGAGAGTAGGQAQAGGAAEVINPDETPLTEAAQDAPTEEIDGADTPLAAPAAQPGNGLTVAGIAGIILILLAIAAAVAVRQRLRSKREQQ